MWTWAVAKMQCFEFRAGLLFYCAKCLSVCFVWLRFYCRITTTDNVQRHPEWLPICPSVLNALHCELCSEDIRRWQWIIVSALHAMIETSAAHQMIAIIMIGTIICLMQCEQILYVGLSFMAWIAFWFFILLCCGPLFRCTIIVKHCVHCCTLIVLY